MASLTNILTSIHGNRAGLDKDNNFVVHGVHRQDSAGNKEVLHGTVETPSTDAELSPGGFSNVGATAAATYSLPTTMAIGQEKEILNVSATTLIMRITSGATTIAFSASATLQALTCSVAGATAKIRKISATRYVLMYANPTTGWAAST